MFYPVENGSVYEIEDNAFGFVFKCQLPPRGYGVNSITGQLQKTDIIKRSEIPQEQYWERPTLPKEYATRRRTEKIIQEKNKYHVDEFCEEIRQREWRRRLCGLWFWNYNPEKKHSEIVYITGAHYFYITYWKFQGIYMDYRLTDMKIWYCLRYIETDPDCLGLCYLTKRKLGKTALAGCWAYERTSRPPTFQHCGIQSKDDRGAKEFFQKAIIEPWKKLPDFFRPIFDTLKSDDPSELVFKQPARKGSTAMQDDERDEGLNSWMDYASATELFYDGAELATYISDEAGKVEKKISIKKRQDVVRYCSEVDGVMKGKQFYTTTVEVDEDTADDHEFQELVMESNPLKRNKNNRTVSGMYTIFLPAHHGFYFDKYGFPDVKRAEEELLNSWSFLEEEHKLRELASAKRKNPMTLQHAFSVDGESSIFNPMLLQEQLDFLSWGNPLTEMGDLVWEEGKEFWIEDKDKFGNIKTYEDGSAMMRPNALHWIPNPKGKYEKVKGWMPENPNSIMERNGFFHPTQSYAFRCGYDPFRFDKTKKKKRSNAAAFIYQMPDISQNQEFNDTFVLRYSQRPEGTKAANMDVLKMLWWCGCQGLFERNVNHWKEHFNQWNCGGFLAYLPGESEPGIYTQSNAGAQSTVQTICNYTEAYINEHIKKVYFKSLIDKRTNGWLAFKVDDTQDFDEPMAAGITLIAVKAKKYRLPNQQLATIESILPYRKAV
jgi:hypothetical protein